MIITAEVTLNAKSETLALPEFKGFVETLKQAFSTFTHRAPSDGAFQVDVTSIKNGSYRIEIHLASDALSLRESSEGKSPFVALDRAIVKTRHKLELWSVEKKLDIHQL
jgi:ribosome-associated translation inhibitor RaiA